MNSAQKIDVAILICSVILLISGFVFSAIDGQRVAEYKENVRSLIASRYPIENATFHSPAIVIETSSVDAFLEKASYVNASVVYLTDAEGYVAVDAGFVYAYNLDTRVFITQNMSYPLFIVIGMAGSLASSIFITLHDDE